MVIKTVKSGSVYKVQDETIPSMPLSLPAGEFLNKKNLVIFIYRSGS
jgi:hypothetical protein